MNTVLLKIKEYADILLDSIMPYSDYITLGTRVIIGLIILFVIVKVIKHSMEVNFFRKNLSALYKSIEDSAKTRTANSSKNRKLYGEQENSTLLSRVDLNLKYSGLQKKAPWLTAELLAILVLAICMLAFIITCFITNVLIIRLFVPCVIVMGVAAYITLQRKRIYNSTSKQISAFANLVANYASATDDIILVLQKSAVMLKGPLRDMINDTCAYARRTGNTIAAMKILEDSIEFMPLKSLIQNLSIAARNEANYSTVIESSREVIRDRIESEASLANIYRTGRMEIMTITFFGIISTLVLSSYILGKPLKMILIEMTSDLLGQAILGFTIISVLAGLYFTFIHVEKGGR